MSKGFAIALVAALVLVPCTAVMSFAEESTTETAQRCCDKGKKCCDKNKDCKGDGDCASCKCNDCQNADCDLANCKCESSAKSDCKCTKSACASCVESECQSGEGGYAGCSQGDCSGGACGDRVSFDALTICGGRSCGDAAQESALSLIGHRLFAASQSATSNFALERVADELVQAPCSRCESVGPNHESPNALTGVYAQPVPAHAIVEHGMRKTEFNVDSSRIQYSIQIIEDPRGCMYEYEPLRRGSPIMSAESKTLLPAIRMLAKNQVVRQVAAPKLICTAGQTAQLEIGGEIQADGSIEQSGVRLAVASEKSENGLAVELAVLTVHQDRDFARRWKLLVDSGQTIVLNANTVPGSQDEAQQNKPAVYVVVTPETVD